MVRYRYDGWGNHKVMNPDGSKNESDTFIGNINPFRYRGYYYDVETGLYYLKTRYYDPETGRFITIDDISYLAPDTINGLNLYAYCGNNPVMNVDPNGTDWWNPFSWDWGKIGRGVFGYALILIGRLMMEINLIPSIFDGRFAIGLQAGFSMASYGGMLIASAFDSQIENDLRNIGWNPFNADANAVGESKKVSFYKGVPVFRIKSERSGTFLGMFLGTGDGGFRENPSDLVRHEWGHIFQVFALGLRKFGLYVAIPSIIGSEDYYRSPWEAFASIIGGVQSDEYSRKEKIKALLHLITAYYFGPISYLFMIN